MYQCLHENHSSTSSHIVSRENPCCVSDRQPPPRSLWEKVPPSSWRNRSSVVWLTQDVIFVLLFAALSATASFVEAMCELSVACWRSSSNLCQGFFSFFANFRETVCFPFFWATLTPVISCAKPVSLKIRCLPSTKAMERETLILPDSSFNTSSVTSPKPSTTR